MFYSYRRDLFLLQNKQFSSRTRTTVFSCTTCAGNDLLLVQEKRFRLVRKDTLLAFLLLVQEDDTCLAQDKYDILVQEVPSCTRGIPAHFHVCCLSISSKTYFNSLVSISFCTLSVKVHYFDTEVLQRRTFHVEIVQRSLFHVESGKH